MNVNKSSLNFNVQIRIISEELKIRCTEEETVLKTDQNTCLSLSVINFTMQ